MIMSNKYKLSTSIGTCNKEIITKENPVPAIFNAKPTTYSYVKDIKNI